MNKLIRLGISAVLLAWVGSKTDWSKFGEAFSSLRLDLWLAGVGLYVLAQAISSRRWQIITRALGFNQSLGQLTRLYFIGTYFSLLLPTSVGGDVIRAWYLDNRSGRRLKAFLSVFLDRLSGLIVLLAMGCLAVVFSPIALEDWIVWSIWCMTVCGLVGLVALPLVAGWFPLGAGRIEQIKMAMRLLRQPRLLAGTTFLALIVQALNVVIVWLIGMALHVNIPAAYYWLLTPMVTLLTMLPITVAGTGVRELTTVLMLAPLGVGHDLAVSLALLWFAVFAAVSLMGGVVYLVGRSAPLAAGLSEEVSSDHGSIGHHPDQGRTGQPQKAA
ncbi:MAG TPA: lysylphosphatidylglycerol synthase transmembrane domain-containing protein [Gemmataceae bacterium]|nr:lysylphosphatidylglycerol synthase transmembrane domain-containing protein [Gemmataceae bacterium]